jgi:hypothetical protein
MGFAITWCAVREDHAEEFLHALGLSPTGATEEIPESLISSAKLDTGWRVVWYNEYGCPFLSSGDLCRLSIDRDVLVCLIEEHVMASSSELWSRGVRRWWISHQGEDGPKGLSIDGEPPSSFPSIREEMEQVQAHEGGDETDVDYIFEIPLKVAQTIVGFRHDDNPTNLTDGHFVVLDRTQPQKKGWRARLFG